MQIALLGYGTVGHGVVKIIESQATEQLRRLHVSQIWVRPEKVDQNPLFTADYQEILANDKIDTIIEVLGGLDPAYAMITDALKHHKNVVTANKAVVARHLTEFTTLARQNHVKFYFESSVGGGIPWIINLERALRIDQIDSIHGIFNGTSNFILDEMMETGAPFDVVLAEAQRRGYAEADPSADLDGDDIENKLCISASIAYDTEIKPNDDLLKFGIRNITAADVSFFKKHHWVVKLIGRSFRRDNRYNFVIEPTLYAPGEIEAGVHQNYNYVGLRGTTIGKLSFNGQGAGELPTAHALIQDLLDLELHMEHLTRNFQQELELDNNSKLLDYVIRSEQDVASLLSDYEVKKEEHDYWIVKQISAEAAHELIQQLEQTEKPLLAAISQQRS
ncbi:homoserine dehydrogenase [Fructilactobacillus hinvesii]|uniref:Homoserine dehydrogenase n=1 Tax=Fructilactobacillus hinvesii TaxID=2940300 RepID=A0ABY5BXM3_9LACO|nr:homoserine dehydrogenase [Fructilactobacillus hinvesii]USS88489.1 homoserine dehydrogenase [Fructilactobacillus hinvesii]